MDGKGSIKELFPTGKQLEPLVAPLADGKVAVGQDDLTVVLNEEGICTQKCALNWTDIPVAMGETSTAAVPTLGWGRAPSSQHGIPFTAPADCGLPCHLLSVPFPISRQVCKIVKNEILRFL